MRKFLSRFNLIRRAYDQGFEDGRESELQAMEMAKVVWYTFQGEDTPHRGHIDKVATIRRWRDTHAQNWKRYGQEPYNRPPIIMREVPHNIHEHEGYLSLFPELSQDDGVE